MRTSNKVIALTPPALASLYRRVLFRLGVFFGEQPTSQYTSIDAEGYLEGAVETGERAADEIIAAMR